MTRDPICLTTIVSVGQVYDILKQCKHDSFPIVGINNDGEPNTTLLGTVPRKILCTLLSHKAFGYYDSRPLEYLFIHFFIFIIIITINSTIFHIIDIIIVIIVTIITIIDIVIIIIITIPIFLFNNHFIMNN